jgi:hypothetical protein
MLIDAGRQRTGRGGDNVKGAIGVGFATQSPIATDSR